MTSPHSTPTYGVPNGTEIRVAVGQLAARLKVTAGALGIADIYGPGGGWLYRCQWTPFSGFDWPGAVDLSDTLALAFHHYVNNRPVARPRRERRAA